MALFRVDFSGRGELADRQQKLAQMLSRLQKIAEGSIVTCDKTENTAGCFKIAIIVFIKNIRYFLEYNVAVFVTNQMTADPGATMSYVYILYFIFQ